MLDMFGSVVSVGDFVLFSDYTEDGDTTCMNLYKVEEIIDTDTAVGVKLTGRNAGEIGSEYYLTGPSLRMVILGDVHGVYHVAGYYEDTPLN